MILHLRILLDVLFPPSADTLLVRKTTLHDLRVRLKPQHRDGVTSLFTFKDPLIRTLIHEAKFGHNTRAQRLLGAILREYLSDTIHIVPIPLSKKRFRERGYNQVAEIARYTGLPVAHILKRTTHTTPQTDLTRSERLINLQNAFKLEQTPSQNLVLLDDVTTTGATLWEAKKMLGDDVSVTCIALAH